MEAGKRRIACLYLAVIMAVLFLTNGKPVRAIPGQLNNGFATPTPLPSEIVVVTPDPSALDECSQKYAQIQTQLNNCQKATVLTSKADSQDGASKTAYLIWAMGSTVIAAVFAIAFALSMTRKKIPPPPPPEPVIPPLP